MTTTGDRIRGAAFDAFVLVALTALTAFGLSAVWACADTIVDHIGRPYAPAEMALRICFSMIGLLIGVAITAASANGVTLYVGTIRRRSRDEAEHERRAASTDTAPNG
jgi:hypothetical protein